MSTAEKHKGGRICTVQAQKTLFWEQKLTDQQIETRSIELEQLIASENWLTRSHMETLLNRAKRERIEKWVDEVQKYESELNFVCVVLFMYIYLFLCKVGLKFLFLFFCIIRKEKRKGIPFRCIEPNLQYDLDMLCSMFLQF